MSDDDRRRWNAKYETGDHAGGAPSPVLVRIQSWIPRSGRALDVAGGSGRHAIWLAQHGLEVTLCDISDVAIGIARRADELRVNLRALAIDLRTVAPPAGPWDVILCVHYLQRELFPWFARAAAPGGVLIVLHPTLANLQKHVRPPAKFLLADDELPRLLSDWRVLHAAEGWLEDGRHESLAVATPGSLADSDLPHTAPRGG